ncbi:hypothetical protein LXL04_023905 [Taraxacum kok-saghyz]
MGGKNSKEGGGHKHSSSYGGYPPQPSSTPAYGAQPPRPQKKLDRRYSRIADNYNSLEQVTEALSRAGLESSNLIVGIDFTKSNEWTGARSFHSKSLHHIGIDLNPYEQAISIIGKTLAAFDEDNLIPCYGFGDATTHDQNVFSFYREDSFCNGFEDVMSRYREIVPYLKLSGPTSFAPVIEQAMTIVEKSGGQYHVLLIIADGQVTRSVDTNRGQLSPQEQKTVEAIVAASKLPLSIVLVGVGDGPWDMMKEFDDNIPNRDFDNFQFVNFTEIMSKNVPQIRKETEFALSALMEIPSQYKATIELNLLGSRSGMIPQMAALPPPVPQTFSKKTLSFEKGSQSCNGQSSKDHVIESISKSTNDDQLCPICITKMKNMAFGCGHQHSKEEGERYMQTPSFQLTSSFSGNQYGGYPPQPSYSLPPQRDQNYPIQDPNPQQHYTSLPIYGTQPSRPQKKLEKRYSRIADSYNSLEQVTEALAHAGLESSNLIVGIDFTKSNEWTGARSFHRKSLHHIGNDLNPYEQAISIIGKTLAAFDEDNLIPCYGFGDATTHDQDVFSFYPEDNFCNGFEDVMSRYREIIPHLKLSGPTSFAPVIEQAMTIVEQSGGQYHVLLIIADGQVTRSVDTDHGQLSPQEQKTVDAIVQARFLLECVLKCNELFDSKLPLSIVLVGVGDGPWDMMKEFDDNIPNRDFDNFQFVNFTEIMSKNMPQIRKETEFALSALMEIPSQYKATIELNLLGIRKEMSPRRVALPPPIRQPSSSYNNTSKPKNSISFQKGSQSYYGQTSPDHISPSISKSTYDNQVCPICLTNPKDMAFGCGHQTCHECGETLQLCPICRGPIQTRIILW